MCNQEGDFVVGKKQNKAGLPPVEAWTAVGVEYTRHSNP